MSTTKKDIKRVLLVKMYGIIKKYRLTVENDRIHIKLLVKVIESEYY